MKRLLSIPLTITATVLLWTAVPIALVGYALGGLADKVRR